MRAGISEVGGDVGCERAIVTFRIKRIVGGVAIGEEHSSPARARERIIVVQRIHLNGHADLFEVAGAIDLVCLGFGL